MQNYNFRSLLRFAIPIVFLLVFTVTLNRAVISNPDVIRAWLDGFGIYAVFAYIVVQSVAIIVAPIGGSAFALAVLALFGPSKGALLIYFVTTPAYIANFFIAKRYGRSVVRKLTGKEGEALVNRFLKEINPKRLVFMKLFLGGYFDYIAYAVGLSDIKARTFVLINLTAGVPAVLFTWFVMSIAPDFMSAVALFYVVPAVIAATYIGLTRLKKKEVDADTQLLEHEI